MTEESIIYQADPIIKKTFFQETLDELGITPELNQVDLLYFDAEKNENVWKPVPIFRENDRGYDIIAYNIDGTPVNYAKEGSRWKVNEYKITRLKVPLPSKNGGTMKYVIPGKQKALPFFPPQLVKKYLAKESIHTLVLTEGYKKAFKGAMHGLDIVGLISITTLEDKVLQEIHEDILSIITTCNVQRVVFLHDGDCANPLKSSADLVSDHPDKPANLFAGGKDLYQRPNRFFQSVVKFKDLLGDYTRDKKRDIDLWFAHVLSDELAMQYNLPKNPKGLDDLLVAFKGNEDDVVSDLLSTSKPGRYFYRINITASAFSKLRQHFFIDDVTLFYRAWVDRYPTLRNQKFVYFGSQYAFDEKVCECIMEIPAEIKDYKRIGTKYYRTIRVPNQHNLVDERLELWDKSTIKDDFGPKFLQMIPRYEAFCNVPSHDNFQQIIKGCYNLYSPVIHPDPNPDDTFDHITALIKHIFGSNDITYTDKWGQTRAVNEYDLGLDYIQLLFQKPQEKLPILCLVSKENETGKSTFCDLLRAIFQGNIISINNKDFKSDFNAHWIGKHIVYVSETLLEKQEYTESIKTLSTDHKALVNTKSVNQYEIDTFLHFILLSNHEDNFVRITQHDTRFWIRKAPVLKDKDPNFLTDMIAEVPAFVQFIKDRKLATQKETRMWFNQALIQTDALRKVIIHNRSQAEKQIRLHLRDMFLDFGVDEIKMSLADIKKAFFSANSDVQYLARVLRDDLKVDQYKNDHGEYTTTRYSYPCWVSVFQDGKHEVVAGSNPGNGRPFVFPRSLFVGAEDEAAHANPGRTPPDAPQQVSMDYDDDDVPF